MSHYIYIYIKALSLLQNLYGTYFQRNSKAFTSTTASTSATKCEEPLSETIGFILVVGSQFVAQTRK